VRGHSSAGCRHQRWDKGIASLATIQPGQHLRATILRDAKVQELTMPWTGR